MGGYAGKILIVDLTRRKTRSIATSDYGQWVGGHGMGSAIFWDLVKDKNIDGFAPANLVTMMTSPLSGTLVPGASGRTEVQTVGVQSYPIGWFTRSNFGGRFSTMLKFAGFDGIVIGGVSETPVWIDIRDGQARIRECRPLSLWGQDTWECQKIIWDEVAGPNGYGKWIQPAGVRKKTTQRPAVVAIGPAGENLSRMACLIHDAGNAAGQGGLGAVWGSKQLKAVSVIGTGDIKIHDPKGLLQARLWQKQHYAFNLDNLKGRLYQTFDYRTEHHGPPFPGLIWGPRQMGEGRPRNGQRPQACIGCHSGCRARYENGIGNEASCIATAFYYKANNPKIQHSATDLLNRYGINAYDVYVGLDYLEALAEMGRLGPGRDIDCPLDFKNMGSYEFVDKFLKIIAYRQGDFGEALAGGFVRAAKKWGRLSGADNDLSTGLLPFPYWGLPEHSYDPRVQLEWGYGSILGDRDVNEHDFNKLFKDPTFSTWYHMPPQAEVEQAVKIYTDKMAPFQGQQGMLDFSTENMYSEDMAKLVAWHRRYTRFWKQSVLYCDWRWPDFLNPYRPDKVGSSGEAEPKFLNAVTGKNLSFEEGIKLGRKIWNLDNAIWTLQGRRRDMVHFADYIYRIPFTGWGNLYKLPGRKDGRWAYMNVAGRHIDKGRFESFKTKFYRLEGWNPDTGWPRQKTLKSLGLGQVAAELASKGKLDKP